MFFSTDGPFSRRPRKADLGATRLGRRGIYRRPFGREPRPRPPPVARAARSQSRKSRVSFAGRPSVSAVPSTRRETPSATESSSKKMGSVDPIPFPYEKIVCCMKYEVYSPQFQLGRTHTRGTRGAGYTAVREERSAHD